MKNTNISQVLSLLTVPAVAFGKSSPSNVTGSYKAMDGQTAYVIQQGNEIEFLVICGGGGIHNDHIASEHGKATIKQDRATFTDESGCKTMLDFHGSQLIIHTGGNCFFPEGTSLEGHYRKISKTIPNLKKLLNDWEVD